jgi:hypothetical protein
MAKPCKLQMNNSGAWKDITRFDAADEEHADDLMNAAAQLADAVNDGAKKARLTLRIVTDEALPDVLMRYDSRETGWRTRTGEPA